jgi:hypothetical protein
LCVRRNTYPYVVNITGRIGRSIVLEYERWTGAGSSLCCGPLDEEVMLLGNLALFAIEDDKFIHRS